MALTNLTKVKQHLGIEHNDDDALLQNLIDAVSAWIETWCGRKFKSQVITGEKHSGDGGEYLWLKNYPVTELTKVEVDGTDVTSDIEYDPDTGELYYSAGFTEGYRNVSVDYTAGYANIPTDLEYACVLIVASIYNKKGLEGRTGEVGQGFSYQIVADDIPFEAKKILEKYKKVVMG